jgi:hypothetical protein
MAEQIRRTVITITVCCLLSVGCVGRYRGPRSLAGIGSALVVGGGATWIAGERSSQSAATSVGFSLVAAGVALVIVAGGWMAGAVGCDADPDCDDAEICREVPAPPGGIPYKQCVPR